MSTHSQVVHLPGGVNISYDNALITGYVIAALTYPNLTSYEAIKKITEESSVMSFVAMAMIAQKVENAASIMPALKAILPTLPHDSISATINICMGVVVLIVAVAVAMRFYTRKFITNALKAEDWWALASMVFLLILYVCFVIGGTVSVTGRHIWDSSAVDIQFWLLWNTVCEVVLSLALMPIKLSFLVFYRSLSPDLWYRRMLFVVGVCFVAISVTGSLLFIFQCRPIDYWNHQFTTRCFDRVKVFTVWGAFTIVSDFALLLLPVRLIFNALSISKKEKITIICMFSAGGLTCIASIMRVVMMNRAYNEADKTWLVGHAEYWCFLELGLAIFVSCLPSLKHFFFGNQEKAKVTNLMMNSWARVSRRRHKGGARVHDPDFVTTMGADATQLDLENGIVVTRSHETDDTKTSTTESKDRGGDEKVDIDGFAGRMRRLSLHVSAIRKESNATGMKSPTAATSNKGP